MRDESGGQPDILRCEASRGVVGRERWSHTFSTSNVTWRFRFFVSISTCRERSSM